MTGTNKVLRIFVLLGLIGITSIINFYYQRVVKPNIVLEGKDPQFIYIPTGSNIDSIFRILDQQVIVENMDHLKWMVEKKNYKKHIHPGRYEIHNRMNNNQLINMLRSGKQVPVKVVFNSLRTKSDLAGIISGQLEMDSVALLDLLNDRRFLSEYNLNPENAMTVFIPNTYELYWNTTAVGFYKRMYKEHQRFWDESRIQQLEHTGLSKLEAIILASIVEQESQMTDERERLAGVYINRLHKGWKLQADPTIKFAMNNFELKRILHEHLTLDSPYNTYKYKGLPPGPICLPSINAIDAVLNFEHHDFLYFCAKDDFSGYHVFAKTLRQHNINAQKYQSALNRNRVFQ